MKRLSLVISSTLLTTFLMACGSGGGGGTTAAPAASTYSISGNVTFGGTGLAGVNVALSGGTIATVATTTTGGYSFNGVSNGTYTVTPTLAGYRFLPSNLAVTVNGANKTAQDFAVLSLLPDTGQTKCYDPSGTLINCADTGQDGMYTMNSPSYTDNGDGTITDNNTHLVWQKQDDGIPRDWDSATAFCTGITASLPGTGWRLPDRTELVSIVNYGVYNPTIQSPFGSTQSDWYWTSTLFAGDTNLAWTVNFYVGPATPTLFDRTDITNINYARCVRGTASGGSLTDNGDETISDRRTGLMWQKRDDGSSRVWELAISYCEGLTLGNGSYSDWRMPNIRELSTIVDDTKNSPASDTTFFPGAASQLYWSSTSLESDAQHVWGVNINDGDINSNSFKSGGVNDANPVLCVRNQ